MADGVARQQSRWYSLADRRRRAERSLMAQFDQAARYLIRRAGRVLAPAPAAPVRGLAISRFRRDEHGRVPRRTGPGVRHRRRLHSERPAGVRRLLVDAEVQAQPHPDMLERLGEYAYRLRRELRFGRRRSKYAVLSALLNLTGRAQPDELDMTFPEAAGAGAAEGRNEDSAGNGRGGTPGKSRGRGVGPCGPSVGHTHARRGETEYHQRLEARRRARTG